MGFTRIASVTGYNSGVGTTVDAISALNVQVGDLLVAWGEWQNAGSGDVMSIAQDDATDDFSIGESAVNSNDIGGGFAWLEVTSADATFTPRLTIDNSSRRLVILVWHFRPDSGETLTKIAEGTIAIGSSASAASGNISPDGTDLVVLGGVSTAGGGGSSSEQIDSTAADEVIGAGGYGRLWYRILTSGFTDGNTTATVTNDNWVCNIVSFKSVAGVGTNPKGPLGHPLIGVFGGPI